MNRITFILTFVVALVVCDTALAQHVEPVHSEPIVLTDAQEDYSLGLHIELLEDPTGELTIEQAISSEYATQFRPSQANVPNLGYTKSAYWVRLPLRNESHETERWLLDLGFANVQYVDLYSPLPDGYGFEVKRTGALRSPDTRDLRHEHFAFVLSIPVGTQQTYYLRVQGGSVTLPLRLWKPTAFFLHAQTLLALRSLFFGALLALLAYNIFLLFSTRESSYLYLIIALASMIVFDAIYSGYTETYLIPNLYYLRGYYHPFAFVAMFASMNLFAGSFLELQNRSPWMHHLNVALLIGWGIVALLVPFVTFVTIASLALPYAVLSTTAIAMAGMHAWLRGSPYARFFVIAWIGLLIAVILAILVRLGAVASTMFSEHAFEVGIVWLAIFWSLALADRINSLKANLQDSEHRLSEILDGLPLGVVVYASDFKPTYTNRRVFEILSNPKRNIFPDLSAGRTLQNAMGYYSFRVTGTNQQFPLADMPVYRALQGEPATTDSIEADLIDKRVPLEIWASPVLDGAGNVESAVVAFQDITQRRTIMAELDRYRSHLEDLVDQRTSELNDVITVLNTEISERRQLEEVQDKLISWLSSINEIQQLLGGSTRLPEAHEQALLAVIRLLCAKNGFIGTWDGDDDQIEHLLCLRCAETHRTVEHQLIRCDADSPARRMMEQGKLLILPADHVRQELPEFEMCTEESDIHSVVLAPIRAEQHVIGLMGLGMPTPADGFTEEEIGFFERIRFDLSNLTEYARLYDKVRALAAVEERSRLARDLHDSVTQVLFSASLLAEVLPTIWRRNPEQAAESLEGLRRLTRSALAEMRTLLLELRPTAVVRTPLSELISQLTDAVVSRSTVESRLQIEQIGELPEDVHVGFYRVAQEALNNVVKHSRASVVEVRLSAPSSPPMANVVSKPIVQLTVSDNGIGFEQANLGTKHMGLSIMRERAAAIGALLSIDGRIGHGTTVILEWQRDSEKRDD